MSEQDNRIDHDDAELWSLVEAHCDGVATPEQQSRLEARLAADPADRRFFVAYMQEQAQIAWLARGERVPAAVPQAPPAEPPSPVLSFLGTAVRLSTPWLSSPKVLALTVVGCLATYFIGLMISIVISRGLWGPHNPARTIEPSTFAAARIISADDCSWESSAPGGKQAAALSAGVSRLIEGVVEIEFDSGARLRIEGPAEFVPQSAGRLELNQGRLTAYVPRQARGFTVGTPTAEVVDLGTEFALAVETDGQTEVHVVRGLVDVKPSVPSGDSKPGSVARLGAGSAVRIAPGQSVARIPFHGDRFKTLAGAAAPQAGAQQQRHGTRDKRFLQSPVQVVNGSFEVPAIRDKAATTGATTLDLSDSGWQLTGVAGLLETMLGQPSDGSQALFVGTSQYPASVYQHVGALSPSTEYTLTVDVCPRTEVDDRLAGSTGFIALVEGTDDKGTVLAKNTSIVQPTRAAGAQTYSVSFATGAAASGPLTVVLGHDGGADVANMQVIYDNVRLTATEVSQPPSTTKLKPETQLKSHDAKPKPRDQPPGRSRTPEG